MKVLALLLLALAPSWAADLGPEKGVPVLRAVEGPSFAASLPSLLGASLAPLQTALLPASVSLAPAQALPTALSLTAVPAHAAPSVSGPSARGPPVAGKAHEPAPGAFAAVRERVLAEVGRNWAMPFEDLFQETDALLLGESHRSLSSYRLLAEQMPRLQKAGVTTIGLEGLKAPHQEAVDRWLAAGPEATLPEQATSFSSARAAEIAALFHAAKAQGIRVVALGTPLEHWAAQVVELASQRARDLDERVSDDLPEQLAFGERTYAAGYNEALSEVVLRRRNEAMAERLAAALPVGGKAVALVGDAHLDHHDALSYRLFWLPLEAYGSLAGELRTRLVRSISVTMTGGLFVNPREDRANHRRIHGEAYALMAQANPDGKPAFYRTSETTGLFHLGGR
jgi:hypothetical protein